MVFLSIVPDLRVATACRRLCSSVARLRKRQLQLPRSRQSRRIVTRNQPWDARCFANSGLQPTKSQQVRARPFPPTHRRGRIEIRGSDRQLIRQPEPRRLDPGVAPCHSGVAGVNGFDPVGLSRQRGSSRLKSVGKLGFGSPTTRPPCILHRLSIWFAVKGKGFAFKELQRIAGRHAAGVTVNKVGRPGGHGR